jgi:hypothetical protein
MGRERPLGHPVFRRARRSRPTKSFTNHCDGNFSPVRRTTMLEQEYALPGSKLHFAVNNRDDLACPRQGHSDMRWHVIAALRAVSKIIRIFRHQTIEKFLQIMSCGGIGIFHDDQAAAGVLNKDTQRPIKDPAFVDPPPDIIGDFVGPLAIGAHFELIVINAHRSARYSARR